MNKAAFIVIICLISIGINAQQVKIKGNAKSYAGDSLFWSSYEDQVTFEEKELAKCKVLPNGDFNFVINTKETVLSFIHLNVFKGILFIEPGKTYEIVLPKKVNRLPEDELNPFFEKTEFYVRALNTDENELNKQIKHFDKTFDKYLSNYFQQFKGKLNKKIADSIIDATNKELPNTKNIFFNNYKKYNYASLRLMAYERNKEKLIKKYFYNKPVLYQNPAYMDMFNQLFTNYLSYFSKTKEGKAIPYFLIKLKNLEKIKGAMDSVEVLSNDTLQELIITKSLFDNFYKDDFPDESIIQMLDSIMICASTIENKTIATNIYKKVTNLRVGYLSPDFQLPNVNRQLKSLAQFRNKFVYLNFINPKSYTTMQELEVLKTMHEKKYELFEIVSICVCDNIEEMKSLVEKNEYKWTFLFYAGNNKLLKNYNVKVYPTYYLINPESKLSMSPAFPPSEPSFEARYFKTLKAWKIELERRKAKEKGKGINR